MSNLLVLFGSSSFLSYSFCNNWYWYYNRTNNVSHTLHLNSNSWKMFFSFRSRQLFIRRGYFYFYYVIRILRGYYAYLFRVIVCSFPLLLQKIDINDSDRFLYSCVVIWMTFYGASLNMIGNLFSREKSRFYEWWFSNERVSSSRERFSARKGN